jgi:hypothetical protein
VDAYTTKELKALFKACDEEERLLFRFFRHAGCREGEASHTEWRLTQHIDRKYLLP